MFKVLVILCLLAHVAWAEPRLYEGGLAYEARDVTVVRAFVLGERVVVQLGEGDVACVDPAHQRILWRERPGGAIERLERRGEHVLVQADDLRLYDGAGGSLRWVYPLTGQRLLHLGPDAAVVAGFGPDPRQVAVVGLGDGALRWPQWAQVPGASAATADGERIYVRAPDGVIVPVDWSTGRVREPVSAAPAALAEAAFPASPVGGRLLVIGPDVAAWLPPDEQPTRVSLDGRRLVVVSARGVRVMEGAPLGERVAACRRDLGAPGAQCVADLGPLLGRLGGADPIVAPLLMEAALGTSSTPDPTADRLARVLALLPDLERVSAPERAPLLARAAQLVAPLVDAGRGDDAAVLLGSLEGLAAQGPDLTELRLGVSTAAALVHLAAARRAWKGRDDEGALAELDALAALPRLAAVLPPEIVDARDGRKELRAALDAVAAALPSKGGSAHNPALCRGACLAARGVCAADDTACLSSAGACFGRCP